MALDDGMMRTLDHVGHDTLDELHRFSFNYAGNAYTYVTCFVTGNAYAAVV